MHERLQDNPEEWQQYHTLYRAARANWSIIPYEYMIDWCRQRSDYVIGDFGCGEALLGHGVRDLHTLHSFDHVAIDGSVTACDMSQVPLNDGELDVAIFSLALMGTDIGGYLAEAHRTLKLDGQLHLIEPHSRLSDPEATTFVEGLRRLGYRNIELTPPDGRFIKITAINGGRPVGKEHALAL